VKTSTSIGIAAACAAAVVALCVLLRDPSSAPAPRTAQELATPAAAAREDAEPRRGAEIDAPAAAGERVAGEVARPAIGAAAPIAPPRARILSGEVLDETGRRLGDVALRFDRGAAPAPFRSDAAGRFETELPAGAEQVLSDDPRWSTVLAGSAIMAADTVSIVVVAPRIDLAGTVVDEDGAALLGADVGVYLPRSFGSDFRRPLDASANRQWDAVTDAEGRFGLPDVPSVEGAALHVVLGGFDTSIEALPIASDPALRIVLRRPRESTGRLAGIVVDPRGGLVRGARVSAGFETAISDEGGRFEIDLVKEPAPTKVTAAKPGSCRLCASRIARRTVGRRGPITSCCGSAASPAASRVACSTARGTVSRGLGCGSRIRRTSA
jgi:hypothetical protein